jgi:hypothetical protein
LSSNPLGLETLTQFCIVQRDDGLWSIGWHDGAAGPFESRRFALAVAARTPQAVLP